MSGLPQEAATADQMAGLRVLSESDCRGEADRARAFLLSLKRWNSVDIGAAFGVGDDSVRRWRLWFSRGGVEALRKKRTEVRISKSRLSVVLRKKGASADAAPATASKTAKMRGGRTLGAPARTPEAAGGGR